MFVLAIGYIVIFVGCILLCGYSGASKRQNDILWGLMIASLSIIALQFDPAGTGLDVVRHFQRIDSIRQSNYTFSQYVFNNYSSSKYLYTFNAVCYLIAKLNISNHILPFLVTLVSYSICFYILRDWIEKEQISKTCFGLSVLVCFAFLPYYFVMCGIRNGVAMCIMGLAVYLYLYKHKSLVLFLCLSAISATIHTSVLIAIPFVLLSRFNLSYKSLGLVLIGSFSLGTVAKTLSEMSIPYLTEMAKSYITYSSDGQFKSAQYFLITDIVLIILFGILLVCQTKYIAPKNKGQGRRIYSFIALYGVYTIGNFGNYDLVLRPAYMFGPLSPMLGYLLYNDEYWKGKAGIQLILKFLVVLICGYTVARYMAFFFTIVDF